MRKLFSVFTLCMCLGLAACGGGATTPTAIPANTAVPGTPTTVAAAATPTTAPAATPGVTATMAVTSTGATTATTGTSGATTPTTAVSTTTNIANATCPHITHVVFATGFTPSVGNAPYYIAQNKGYYAANCLDVEIKYGQVANLTQLVANGDIQFMSVTGDSIITARLKGANIKYVMAIYQKYPVGALALADKGFTISSPADLKGHSIGYSAAGSSTQIGMEAMLKAGGLTDNDVKEVQIGFNEVEALSSNQVDIAFTFLSNEAVQMRALGYKLQTLQLPNSAGLISSGVAAGDKLIQEHPDVVQGFVKATLMGLQDALANPSAAFDTSLPQLGDLSPDKVPVQRDVMTATLDYMQPPTGHPLGWSDPAGWSATQDLLKATNIISDTADPTTYYTNQFAEAAGIGGSGGGNASPTVEATPAMTSTGVISGTGTSMSGGCTTPTHVVFATGFTPSVGNAAYYIAADKGYYKANCLDVEIKYGQVANLTQLVANGDIQFMSVTGDSVIPARLKGANIKYVMAIYQKYPVGALALADKGFTISSPADLKGHSIGYSAAGSSTQIGMEAMLKAGGLTDNDVKEVQIGFNEVEALSSNQVDIAFTFLSNEAVQMRALGYKLQTLQLPNSAGLISSGVAAGDKLIQEHPDVVQAFVSATLHGLKDALADPSAAFDTSLKQLGDLSPDKVPVQRDVMTATLGYMQPPTGHPLGWSDPAGWSATQDLLKATNIISDTADPTTYYTNQFAEAAKQ